MYLRTSNFAKAVAETTVTVRGVYGRPGREPRNPAGQDLDPTKYRQFGWSDAVAWRIVRHLCDVGLTWDQAAQVCRDQACGDYLVDRQGDCDRLYLAVYQSEGDDFLVWMGEIDEIAGILNDHNAARGMVRSVRMISLRLVLADAATLLINAGLAPAADSDGFVAVEGAEVDRIRLIQLAGVTAGVRRETIFRMIETGMPLAEALAQIAAVMQANADLAKGNGR